MRCRATDDMDTPDPADRPTVKDPATGRVYTPLSRRYRELLQTSRKRKHQDGSGAQAEKRNRQDESETQTETRTKQDIHTHVDLSDIDWDDENFDYEFVGLTDDWNDDVSENDQNTDFNAIDGGSHDGEDSFIIEHVAQRDVEKYGGSKVTLKAKLKEKSIEDKDQIMNALHGMFSGVIDRVGKKLKATDKMRMILYSKKLDRPISTKLVDKTEMSSELILTQVEKVLQSHEEFVVDEDFYIEMVSVQLPEAGGARNKFFASENEFVNKKNSVIRIQNDDNLCCGRALVVAKARVDNHPQWNNIRRGRTIQTDLTKELYAAAGVKLGPCNLDDIQKFQNYLVDYQIVVMARNQLDECIFAGPPVSDENKRLLLYFVDKPEPHYHVITKLNAFLGSVYFCWECFKGHNNKKTHRCEIEGRCKICNTKGCHPPLVLQWKHCQDCNRYFQSETCFKNHKTPNEFESIACDRRVRCVTCRKLHDRNDDTHVCWARTCRYCKGSVDEDHLCYIQPEEEDSDNDDVDDSTKSSSKNLPSGEYSVEDIVTFEITDEDLKEYEKRRKTKKKDNTCTDSDELSEGEGEEEMLEDSPQAGGKKKKKEKPKVYFFDFETEMTTGRHVPILCVVKEENSNIAFVAKGKNTTEKVCSWMLREEHKNAIYIAHNLKGFDGHFVLEYLLHNGIKPKVTYSGGKIMCMVVPRLNIKFLDSCNFIPMPLAKFPKTFGFTDMTKGYFPHLFSSFENMNYVGPLPETEMYATETMSPDYRAKCLAWLESKRAEGYIFDYGKDAQEYCLIDVLLLERGVNTFRDKFKTVSQGIDPIAKCITIASACNLLYRTLFLEPDQIGIVPPHGYRFREVQSREAIEWLDYVAKQDQVKIHHAKNSAKEVKVCGMRVDGFVEGSPGTVYEYQGCFFHGCPECYNSTDQNPVNHAKMWELFAETKRKREIIKEHGYGYVEIWSHEFHKLKKTEAYKTHAGGRTYPIDTPSERAGVENLDPRAGFYGGRTNASVLYHRADLPSETIQYIDFTSLYPWTNKYCSYPIQHPEIIVDDFEDLSSYYGMAKCRVLPPRQLLHPVLPCRVGDKLMFHLCNACAHSLQQTPCTHSDEERSFVGTWVTEELEMARRKGYQICELFEVHHFPESSDTLFTKYIDMFLKLKQEASGWPEWVTDDKLSPAERLEKENEYIQKYYENEGILLDRDNIKKNPGMRALAKLCLNSFWGKFGMRSNFTKTEYVTSPARLFQLIRGTDIEISGLDFPTDQIAEVHYANTTNYIASPPNTNIYIAAFTTAHARLKLYRTLDKLGDAVLYYDTDSIIYRCNDNNRVELGDYLGDFTNEVENNGGYITEFCSGGPKNYSYVAADGTTVCKVRGFTLNYQNQKLINFEVMRDMVRGGWDKTVDIVTERKITRDKKAKTVVNKREVKRYRLVYNKRVVQDDLTTLPYGY